MQYGMMIELDKCVRCMACVSACKERWDTGPEAARDWVHAFETGKRGKDLALTFFPGLCMQCEDHPCTTDCPTEATYVNENGVIVVDKDLCIGCGNCVTMCPYGARTVDDKKGIVEKCNLCAPYVAEGGEPACVTTCLAECRIFGDLDDPNSRISKLIKEQDAKTLTTPEINVGPHVYYSGEKKRQIILSQGVIRQPKSTTVTKIWQNYTRPVAHYAVPAIALGAGAGGIAMNIKNRNAEEHRPVEEVLEADAELLRVAKRAEEILPKQLPRHRFGLRFLHWFNLLSWIFLVLTGTALMIAPSYALFGTAFPKAVSHFFGGQPNMILAHVLWGLFWSVVIIPLFIYYKHGGLEALQEIMFTKDDMKWMIAKPLVMMGVPGWKLPPQDKYNAGQKGFALTALGGTTLIVVSGFIMAFHIGSGQTVAAAILVHKLAVGLALVGLSVHITMAAIMKEERPALISMFTGKVDMEHALRHSTKWVEEWVDEEEKRLAKEGKKSNQLSALKEAVKEEKAKRETSDSHESAKKKATKKEDTKQENETSKESTDESKGKGHD